MSPVCSTEASDTFATGERQPRPGAAEAQADRPSSLPSTMTIAATDADKCAKFEHLCKRALHTPVQVRHEYRESATRHAISILGDFAPHSKSKPARRPAPAVKTVTLRGIRGDIHKASSINGRTAATHSLLCSALWEQSAFHSLHPPAHGHGGASDAVCQQDRACPSPLFLFRARRLRPPRPSLPLLPERTRKEGTHQADGRVPPASTGSSDDARVVRQKERAVTPLPFDPKFDPAPSPSPLRFGLAHLPLAPRQKPTSVPKRESTSTLRLQLYSTSSVAYGMQASEL
ncbi:hypothetical protein B0H13DRAFT_2471026 [Mycena leptocephala]|nr:hypothetical protein B0H13DRAFT_2471026 [Mycena leptocephala]